MKVKAKASALTAAVLGLALGAQAKPATPNYLTFTAEEAGSTIKLGWYQGQDVEINTNGTWESYGKNTQLTLANVGDKVQFRGVNLVSKSQPNQHIRMTGAIAASGSVTSLIDANGGDPYVALPAACFNNLFSGCTNMTVAPELPALNLTNQCYSSMFSGTWITKAPKLPATVLKEKCYANMFASCKYLLTPVRLDHVTAVDKDCCRQMYSQCLDMKVYADDTHEGYTKAWKATSATEGAEDWSTDMFPATDGGLQEAPTVGETYYVANVFEEVTVTIPEVAGATAVLFAFDANGGWQSVKADEVPSNATVRVVWTADADKALTGAGAVNVYKWQQTFVADKSVQVAPAPTAGEGGVSEVEIALDTRTTKSYFNAADILPVWAAAGATVEAKKTGEQSTLLVVNMSSTNTFAWTPGSVGTYTLSHPGLNATLITLSDPVEVTTNGLEIAKATVAVTDAGGQPLKAQAEGAFAGKLIVPSNDLVRVVWTVTEAGYYFADGSTTYVAEFNADKSVNPVVAAVELPVAPAQPSVKVGVVAQRYPWNGTVDIQYWAKNTPADTFKLKVTVEIGGVSKDKTYSNIVTGVGQVAFDIRDAFGEVTATKCRVFATLVPKN